MANQQGNGANAEREKRRSYIRDMAEQLAIMAAEIGDAVVADALTRAASLYETRPRTSWDASPAV